MVRIIWVVLSSLSKSQIWSGCFVIIACAFSFRSPCLIMMEYPGQSPHPRQCFLLFSSFLTFSDLLAHKPVAQVWLLLITGRNISSPCVVAGSIGALGSTYMFCMTTRTSQPTNVNGVLLRTCSLSQV